MISHYVIHIGAMAFATFAIALSDDIVSFPLKMSHGQQIQGGLQGTRRRLQMQEPPSSFPVYQEYGAYYVEIYVGSPPQKQTVLVDSGSENTGIPCADCVDCGERHVDPNFKQSVSGSFRQLKCSDCQKGRCEEKYDTCAIQSFYAEKSSWQGNEVEDDVYLGLFKGERDSKKFRPKFTCMESNEGEFKDQLSNGIMGMNLDKFSFWRQMHEQGIMKKKKFSLCLNTHPLSKHVIGSLTMGGVDERLGHRDSDMEFFDFTDSNGLFGVEMRKVYIHSSKGNSEAFDGAINLIRNDTLAVEVNDRALNYGGVKLDSGTTGTLLAPIIRKPFMEAWEKVTGKAFPTEPINISPKELEKWPTIIIQMKGSSKVSNASGRQKPVFDENHPNDVLVTLPPSHYMYFNLGSRKYNPIIKFDGSHGRGRYVVQIHIFMKCSNYDTSNKAPFQHFGIELHADTQRFV